MLAQEKPPMTGTAADETKWYDVIGRLKTDVAKFWANYNALLRQKDFIDAHPEMKMEYAGLVRHGTYIKSEINRVNAIIEKVKGWWSYIKAGVGFGELGAIQLLPIAVIAGASAIILKWLADVYVFAKKIEEIKRLEAKGLSPAKAAAIVERISPTSGILGGFLGKNMIWVVAAGAMMMFWPQIMKMMKGR